MEAGIGSSARIPAVRMAVIWELRPEIGELLRGERLG